MKIIIGSDHGGYELKEYLKSYLSDKYEVLDVGTDSEDSVDYPVYAKKCANEVLADSGNLGIICCGTGIGVSIVSNKVSGIRCALCTDSNMSRLAKEHNNANMLALGGRIIEKEDAKKIVDAWLEAEFEGGRHLRRVNAIEEERK